MILLQTLFKDDKSQSFSRRSLGNPAFYVANSCVVQQRAEENFIISVKKCNDYFKNSKVFQKNAVNNFVKDSDIFVQHNVHCVARI